MSVSTLCEMPTLDFSNNSTRLKAVLLADKSMKEGVSGT